MRDLSLARNSVTVRRSSSSEPALSFVRSPKGHNHHNRESNSVNFNFKVSTDIEHTDRFPALRRPSLLDLSIDRECNGFNYSNWDRLLALLRWLRSEINSSHPGVYWSLIAPADPNQGNQSERDRGRDQKILLCLSVFPCSTPNYNYGVSSLVCRIPISDGARRRACQSG